MVFLLIIIPLLTFCYFSANLTCQGLSAAFLFYVPVPAAMHACCSAVAAEGQNAHLPRLHKEVQGCMGQEESHSGILHATGLSPCRSQCRVKTPMKRGVGSPSSTTSPNRQLVGHETG